MATRALFRWASARCASPTTGTSSDFKSCFVNVGAWTRSRRRPCLRFNQGAMPSGRMSGTCRFHLSSPEAAPVGQGGSPDWDVGLGGQPVRSSCLSCPLDSLTRYAVSVVTTQRADTRLGRSQVAFEHLTSSCMRVIRLSGSKRYSAPVALRTARVGGAFEAVALEHG